MVGSISAYPYLLGCDFLLGLQLILNLTAVIDGIGLALIRSVRSGAVIVADYIVRIDSLNYGSVFYYAVLICIAQSILL